MADKSQNNSQQPNQGQNDQGQQPLDLSVVNAAPLEVKPPRVSEDANVVKLSDENVEIPVGDENYGSTSSSDLRPVGE